MFLEAFIARSCLANVSQLHKTRVQRQFCLKDAIYASATRQRILTRTRAYEQQQDFFVHEEASTRLLFASTLSKRQNLQVLLN